METPPGPIGKRASERRSERRYPCSLPAALMPDRGGDPVRATVGDLSRHGALIECLDPHVTPIAIAIALKESVAEIPVRILGRRDKGAILELRLGFGEMTPENRKALDQIVDQVKAVFLAAQEDLVWRVDDPQYYRPMFEGVHSPPARVLKRRSA